MERRCCDFGCTYNARDGCLFSSLFLRFFVVLYFLYLFAVYDSDGGGIFTLNKVTYVYVCIVVINMILQKYGLSYITVRSKGRAGGIKAIGCDRREMFCSFNWLVSFKLA
jgi:hypothetical protein